MNWKNLSPSLRSWAGPRTCRDSAHSNSPRDLREDLVSTTIPCMVSAAQHARFNYFISLRQQLIPSLQFDNKHKSEKICRGRAGLSNYSREIVHNLFVLFEECLLCVQSVPRWRSAPSVTPAPGPPIVNDFFFSVGHVKSYESIENALNAAVAKSGPLDVLICSHVRGCPACRKPSRTRLWKPWIICCMGPHQPQGQSAYHQSCSISLILAKAGRPRILLVSSSSALKLHRHVHGLLS